MARIKSSRVIKIVALVFYFLLAFFLARAQVVSDFSSAMDGWSTIIASAGQSYSPTYNSSGGNTGGCISIDLTNPTSPFYFYADRSFDAPVKFLGNKSFSYNQNLTFDLQQSLAGADASAAEVVISGGGVTIYFPVSSFPSTTSWTSYTVLLNETAGWKTGSLSGASTTKNEMKSALSNITSLRIRAQYFPSFPVGLYSCKIDNVILNVLPLGVPPIVTSLTPQSAVAGTTLTITGTNFNTIASQNNIYFNGVKAVPSSATATQLVVTVPTSAAYGQLVVENLGTNLQGLSPQSFSPLFDNNKDFGGQIIPSSMAQGNKALLPMSNSGNSNSNMDKGDFDGDGWVDLVAGETQSTTIYVFRNLGVTGTMSPSSFSAGNILAGLSLIPGGSPNLGPLTVADVDNDGKPDIVAVTSSNNAAGFLAVFHNTSTGAGSISFANPQFFGYPYYSSQLTMASADLDGDGRKDFFYTTGTSPGGIWVNQNISTPGNVDFAYGISVGDNFGHTDITAGDLNSDGKPEIISSTGATIEIYQNTSMIGSISVNTPFTITAASSNRVAAADLDADNKLDLAWSGSGPAFVYFSKNIYSGSTFDATSFGSTIQIKNTLSNPRGISVSDINADGKVDVVMTGDSDLGIMENVGVGALSANSFLQPTLFQGSAGGGSIGLVSPAIADLDGDNKPDVAAVYVSSGAAAIEKGVYIFHNESYPAPHIDTMTPSSGMVGTNVNFVGDYFSTGLGFPPVFGQLGAIDALIVPSSNTSATATVPPLSISSRFSFTEHGLTAYGKRFNVLFGPSQSFSSSSFGSDIDLSLTGTVRDALAVADFDDDGKADIAVIDNLNTVKIFKNTHATPGQPIASSSLTLEGTTYSGSSLTTSDVDGDGKTDLINGFTLLQNTSSGSISFTSVVSTVGGYSSASADFNKDGKIDLAFTNFGANVQVYENLSRNGSIMPSSSTFYNFGGGAITLATPSTIYSVAAADFDGDGYDDIISVSPNTNNSSYFLNNKIYGRLTTASFSSLGDQTTSGLQPYDVNANDFDGDGKIDIAITYFNSPFVSVLLNNSTLGNISFTGTDITVADKGYKITSQDLDGDGKAEIVVIHQPNPGPGSYTVLQNKSTIGTVNFTATNFPLTRNPQAINVADINGDQKPDILIVANGGSGNALMVFENKIPSPVITVTSQPSPNYSVCNGATQIISTAATGTTNIAYQWQIFNTGSGSYNDLTNTGGYNNVSTSSLTINSTGNFGAGTYRCKINGDFAATVYSNAVSFTVNALPPAPNTQGATECTSTTFTLTASGGTNGQYVWYTTPSGGSAIPGELNSTYTTPVLTTSTTYYVSINNGTCESARSPVTATINTSGCSAPVITSTPLTTEVGGIITLDLIHLITTTNSSLNVNSIVVTKQPSSGATASVSNGVLTINYNGITFSGSEQITIQACDMNGNCATQDFNINVAGDIVVYNGISPGGKNPALIIEYINLIPETKDNTVHIFDRWQNPVWHGTNYDNTSVVFTGVSDGGSDLPTGVYYYKINFSSGRKTETGFISLRRQ